MALYDSTDSPQTRLDRLEADIRAELARIEPYDGPGLIKAGNIVEAIVGGVFWSAVLSFIGLIVWVLSRGAFNLGYLLVMICVAAGFIAVIALYAPDTDTKVREKAARSEYNRKIEELVADNVNRILDEEFRNGKAHYDGERAYHVPAGIPDDVRAWVDKTFGIDAAFERDVKADVARAVAEVAAGRPDNYSPRDPESTQYSVFTYDPCSQKFGPSLMEVRRANRKNLLTWAEDEIFAAHVKADAARVTAKLRAGETASLRAWQVAPGGQP